MVGGEGCEELKMMLCVFKSLDFDITQDGTDFNGAPPRNKDTSGTWILWMEISLPEKGEQDQTKAEIVVVAVVAGGREGGAAGAVAAAVAPATTVPVVAVAAVGAVGAVGAAVVVVVVVVAVAAAVAVAVAVAEAVAEAAAAVAVAVVVAISLLLSLYVVGVDTLYPSIGRSGSSCGKGSDGSGGEEGGAWLSLSKVPLSQVWK